MTSIIRTTAIIVVALSIALSTRTASAADIRPAVPGFVNSIVSAHAGRPTIIHFWGLTCSICMAELSDWGDFKANTTGPDLVLVNWDVRSSTLSRIISKLKTTNLTEAEQWMLGDGFEDRLRFEIDPNWIGELPYTRLVAKDGSISTFSGKADFAFLKAWLTSEANR